LVYVGEKGTQPDTPDFDWALMSVEMLRKLSE